ncbi:hypothetical protein [Micromonospora sp. NPDC005197]
MGHGPEKLTDAGVPVAAVPDVGDNIMLDNPDGAVAATATALEA